jgi:hypothetical protein
MVSSASEREGMLINPMRARTERKRVKEGIMIYR